VPNRTPEDLRRESHHLVETAASKPNLTAKRKIASRAFALAQEAEAIERASTILPSKDKSK